MKKQLLASILFFYVSSILIAQDVHLSQFYASDHLLSPAKMGDFEGDYRFTGNYRNQWRQISKPITTSILSFDKAFHYYSHEFDAGIVLINDQFAGFGMVTNKILFAGAYARNFKGNNFRVGIQTGIVLKKTDLGLQTFPEQWDYETGTFNQSYSSDETTLNSAQNYLDLNLGLQWQRKFGKFQPKAGLAIDHINRPKDSYLPTYVERLRARKVFYAEVDYVLSKKITIQPKWLWMWTTKANDMVLGSNVRYAINNKVIPFVHGGLLYRKGVDRIFDALVPVVGCNYKKMLFGVSYDINLSSLSEGVSKRRGTLEISIIYTAPSLKPKFITLPCDRY